ncbi:MAG: succinylglutamate desuccinylase/aspartoacylase family protein [Gammaproteobacteria bacterium]|nr:succinylglutamate desuccinylase/aspartoacylase family protein [Gammaproteobacteria bacterium]
MNKTILCILAATILTVGCATPRYPDHHQSCHAGSVLIDAHFDGGQIGNCRISDTGRFDLTLFPEDYPPINKSPWFAFRVSGQPGDEVTVRMQFHDAYGYARYWPKISYDGISWRAAPEDSVTVLPDSAGVQLSLTLEQARVWIAGQEILAQDFYRQWINELEAHPALVTTLAGRSIEGRPLYLAESADQPEFILMIGRQHPPEVTGAIAMRSFIDTVLADTGLAREFRARFKLAIVPLMNPDGVAAGHWRHNQGGKDVNRDWGPFTEPETQSIIRWVEQQEAQGRKLQLMLDFHSTFEDLFYTQPVTENPPDFASLWLRASADRLPGFPFKHAANPVSDQPNAKNYFYTSRGIPAITYESGDETDRSALKASAVIFAEEMMKAMLARPAN